MAIRVYELVGADPARAFSPHCWKTVMALAHKGLPMDRVPTPFTAVKDVEGGVSKTIPVIKDGGKVVSDSFAIAEYLEDAYPDRPSLFGGPGGRAMARFVESWSQRTIHPFIGSVAIIDIHNMLAPDDQAYFRASCEAIYKMPLEQVIDGREERLTNFLPRLDPLRVTLSRQPWIGGKAPLFPDYIVFGALQWLRVASSFAILPKDDAVSEWFGRCLDLHGGLGRNTPACA